MTDGAEDCLLCVEMGVVFVWAHVMAFPVELPAAPPAEPGASAAAGARSSVVQIAAIQIANRGD